MSTPPSFNLADGPPGELTCPVCRRRQPLTDTCERCRADLTLLRATWDAARGEWEAWRAAVTARDRVAAARCLATLELLAAPADRGGKRDDRDESGESGALLLWERVGVRALLLGLMLLLGFGLGRLRPPAPVPAPAVATPSPEPEPEPEPYRPSWRRDWTGDGWSWRRQ